MLDIRQKFEDDIKVKKNKLHGNLPHTYFLIKDTYSAGNNILFVCDVKDTC